MTNRFFFSLSSLMTFATLTLFTLALVPPAFAEYAHGQRCDNCQCEQSLDAAKFDQRGPGQRFERLAEILELSTAQRSQIDQIVADEREASREIREQLRGHREKLRTLTESDTFDEAAIRAVAAQKAELKIELMVAHARTRHAINAVLTPEQRSLAEKLRPMLKAGKKGRHGGHERGPRSSR